MIERPTILLAILAAIAAAATLVGGCGEIRGVLEPCDDPNDCPAPWVCCNTPRLPNGDPPPYCLEMDQCEDWMPILITGNPCNRAGGGTLDEQCRLELECCPDTLTCAAPGQCPAPPAPPERGSGLPCGADPDCAAGELCCLITFNDRDGACATVAECRSGDIPQPPQGCPAPLALCDQGCFDLKTSASHCGVCGVACNTNFSCVDGICLPRPFECQAPILDCNLNPSDGCESDIRSSSANCGGCGRPCPPTYINASDLGCREGVCAYVCNGGAFDCNGAPDDGCESPTPCP